MSAVEEPTAEASSNHAHTSHQSEIPPETSPVVVSSLTDSDRTAAAAAAAATSASTPTKQPRGARKSTRSSTTGMSSRQHLAALTAMGSKAFKLSYPLDRAPTPDGDPVHLLNGLEDSKTELMRRVNRTELAMVIEDVFMSARQARLTQIALAGRCCGIWCRGPPPQTSDTIVELLQVVDTYNRSFERRRLQLQLYPSTGTPILLNLIADEITPQPAVEDAQEDEVAAPAASDMPAQVATTVVPAVVPTPQDVDAVESPAQPTLVVAPETVQLEEVHDVPTAQDFKAPEESQLRPISPEGAAAAAASPEVGPSQHAASEQAAEAKPAQAKSPVQADLQQPMTQRTSSGGGGKDSDDEADEDSAHAAAAAAAAAAEAEAAAAARRARGAAEVLDVSFDDVDRSGLDENERHERFLAMLKDKAAAEKAAEDARLAQMDPEEREKYLKAQEDAKKRQEAKDRMLKGQLAGYGSGRALGGSSRSLGAKRGRGAKRP